MTAGRNSVEYVLRAFAAAAYVLTLLAIFNNWRVNDHPYTLLMLMVAEGFTLALVVFAYRAVVRDSSPLAMAAVVYTSAYFLLLQTRPSVRLIPEWAALVGQFAGLALTVVAKAQIGRSFGVLPAVRKLAARGPYAFVRHPIYLGYLIGNCAFLLANASVRNGLVLGALFVVQIFRILREEKVFLQSELGPTYIEYCAQVPFRLVPFVF